MIPMGKKLEDLARRILLVEEALAKELLRRRSRQRRASPGIGSKMSEAANDQNARTDKIKGGLRPAVPEASEADRVDK
jgi:hypothetical protein